MSRRVVGGVEIDADFTGLAKFVGSGDALVKSLGDEEYRDVLIRTAHGIVEKEFNVQAAATAAAGGGIRHMFEWGTLGVNRGRTNMRPNPLSERARLWQTHLIGHGFSQTLTYTFKPSLAFVPKPTKRDTGMSTEVISSLKNHIFQWKAEVLETGAMVTIIPKTAKMLLIPYYPEGDNMFSDRDKARGFLLSKGPHTFSPGDNGGTTGNFTKFFSAFWEGQGAELMDKAIETQVETDFFPTLAVNYSPAMPTKPMPGTFTKEVEKQSKIVRAKVKSKAAIRKETR